MQNCVRSGLEIKKLREENADETADHFDDWFAAPRGD